MHEPICCFGAYGKLNITKIIFIASHRIPSQPIASHRICRCHPPEHPLKYPQLPNESIPDTKIEFHPTSMDVAMKMMASDTIPHSITSIIEGRRKITSGNSQSRLGITQCLPEAEKMRETRMCQTTRRGLGKRGSREKGRAR